jgi:hypothetical protein
MLTERALGQSGSYGPRTLGRDQLHTQAHLQRIAFRANAPTIINIAATFAIARLLLSRMVRIGMHPTDDVGIAKIPARVPPNQEGSQFEWQTLFTERCGQVNWISEGDVLGISNARNAVVTNQRPLVDDVLFAKTYFALEETGLGYPSIVPRQDERAGPA